MAISKKLRFEVFKRDNFTCAYCGRELKPLNPPVEDYLDHKFCIKLFGWKLMLLKDHIEMGCPDCIIDKQRSREQDNFNDAVSKIITRREYPSRDFYF